MRVLGCTFAAFYHGFLKKLRVTLSRFCTAHGSPDSCILPLHRFIVILDPVLFVCEGKCNCVVVSFGRFRVKLRGSV